MARKSRQDDGPNMFDAQERIARLNMRRQRALIIPRLLSEAAQDRRLSGADQDRAFAEVVRWADLETRGALADAAETNIDTQFLDQIFGTGLGYKVRTTSPDAWQLEHKKTVPGVGTADGAIGDFPAASSPIAVIELKDANTDLDRQRFNGRTPVQQCWDYLNALPACPWGIVSNFKTIRLYHRERGSLAYEEFSLQEMARDRNRFNEFYYLLEVAGLLPSRVGQTPRALALLEKTRKRQQEVGDELYEDYQSQRLRLINHLVNKRKKPFDAAIRIAQKLLDRIIFIAFCEDRLLLPEHTLEKAYTQASPFLKAKNPRWQNFLGLFHLVDVGGREIALDAGYNGGLFAEDAEIDELQLEDEPWTTGFKQLGRFDFSEEVSVEVLGHLFERSITELEKLRVGGKSALLRDLEDEDGSTSKMPRSAKRKRFGIYYTPPAFTGLIVDRTVDALVRERFAAIATRVGVDPDAREGQDSAKLLAYWRDCLADLKTVTVCDPACGSGAFLIRAYDCLDGHYKVIAHGLAGAGAPPAEVAALEDSIPDLILKNNLFGVDLSAEGVEITQLALWIRSARKGKTLADLSRNIIRGNSLVADAAVDPHALDWTTAFPQIFAGAAPGFSCVIGNPPWERVKVQDREFFSLTDPETAEAVSAADRKSRIAAMPDANPELHVAYEVARENAQKMLDYARRPSDLGGRFPLTGKGDVNTYMLFAELARSLVAPAGLVGLLVPSGIATDDTTKGFFNDLMDSKRLIALYDFENKQGHFADVHRSFKFSVLICGGTARTTGHADFVFFAHAVEEIAPENKQRHIPLTAADMKLVNPNTRTCPIFRTRRDADLTKAIYKRIPILIDENRRAGGNPWEIKFLRMFDQTNDAEHFHDAKYWKSKGFKLSGNVFIHGKKRALPLYEAKMVQAFDHRAASVLIDKENWVRQGQKEETSLVEHANPEFAVLPRWWVDEAVVTTALGDRGRGWMLGYKDVTSPTNERTMIAAILPRVGAVNSAPIMFVGDNNDPRREACLLANLNSFVYDFVARQKVGNVHLNFFIVEQLPTLPPDAYADKCPWNKRETLEHWISERVLKLSCTAEDMIPLAAACDFKGSRGDGVHIWKEAERVQLRAELDAAYFHLYGIERDDVEYILSTFTNTGLVPEDQRSEESDRWTHGGVGDSILRCYDDLAERSTRQ